MGKYSLREFLKSCSPFALLFIGFASGALVSIGNHQNSMHTEKQFCEYVEKAECKQVWIKVRG